MDTDEMMSADNVNGGAGGGDFDASFLQQFSSMGTTDKVIKL